MTAARNGGTLPAINPPPHASRHKTDVYYIKRLLCLLLQQLLLVELELGALEDVPAPTNQHNAQGKGTTSQQHDPLVSGMNKTCPRSICDTAGSTHGLHRTGISGATHPSARPDWPGREEMQASTRPVVNCCSPHQPRTRGKQHVRTPRTHTHTSSSPCPDRGGTIASCVPLGPPAQWKEATSRGVPTQE